MAFRNFSIWYGRLPHWRAESVRYYVTFRHRRELTEPERRSLVRALLKAEGRKWEILILCVLPGETNLIFTVCEAPNGEPYELSDIVEKAKLRAGKDIVKSTGERFPPFYHESYDRIIRDQSELEQRLKEIYESPVAHELVEESEAYDGLWVASS